MSEVTKKIKKKIGIMQFFSEVRAEARKVTWATWGETRTSSIMVVIMALVAAGFFMLADGVMGAAVKALLNFATSL